MIIRFIYIFTFFFCSLLAEEENIKYVTFDVKDYKKVTLKLLHLKNTSKKLKGLQNKKEVSPFDGLFLEVNNNELARIWMKDMYIPIDIIFISENGEIINLIEDATPCTNENNCTIYTTKNAKYIIETNSGFIVKNYINYVDSVKIETK